MNVQVIILVDTQPNEDDLSNLKLAASKLTNKQSSIAVHVNKEGRYYALTTDFTMKNAAQYKVVDDIDEEFQFWTVELNGYQETTIRFPRI